MRIALQLYSVREDCSKDLERTLKAVAEMGYEGVEFAGFYGRSPEHLRRIIEDLGLEVAGAHLSLDSLTGEELKKTVEFNSILGNSFLIVPWLPEERFNSRDRCLELAGLLNSLAEKLRDKGIRIGYHNHVSEFKRVDGETAWDIIFSSTVKDVVMQLDTGNAIHGGVSADGIIDIIRRYPGRAVTVHVKEFSSSNPNALIGEGEMNWREFLELCETTGGTEWLIVEQESYAYAPLECVRRCLENVKRILLLKNLPFKKQDSLSNESLASFNPNSKTTGPLNPVSSRVFKKPE
ncbi:MAG: sugar phosphate isomerase/epimerase family protein, partial [Thermoproteota archaeon]